MRYIWCHWEWEHGEQRKSQIDGRQSVRLQFNSKTKETNRAVKLELCKLQKKNSAACDEEKLFAIKVVQMRVFLHEKL